MINKPSTKQVNTQPQQNYNKTQSTLFSIQAFVPTSPSNSTDHQKLFFRKPSFKYYQRKEKRDVDPQNKICFISPEKSDIFKKYTPYRSTQTDLNSSYLTNVSSEISSSYEDHRKSFKPRPSNQSDNSRSILNEINNIKPQDILRTPKNIKNDVSFFMTPSNLKRMTFNRGKIEDSAGTSQFRPDFDKDFQTLYQTKNSERQSTRKSTSKNFEDLQRKQYQKGLQRIENQCHQNEEVQMLYMQLNILKESLEQLNIKYNTIEIQKKQLQDSSKIFLSQIKSLQLEVEKATSQKDQVQAQVSKLNIQLTEKNKKIIDLQKDLAFLQKESKILEQKYQQQEINQNYKALYFQVNQKLKYMEVQNSMLKKFWDQKKQEQRKVQKLQVMNKKLISKNKILLRSISELEEELQNAQLQNLTQKKSLKDLKGKPGCKSSKDNQSLTKSRTPSFILRKNSRTKTSENQRQNGNVDQTDGASTGSLQLSFELSPQKNCSSRFKQESQESEYGFMTPNKCFN